MFYTKVIVITTILTSYYGYYNGVSAISTSSPLISIPEIEIIDSEEVVVPKPTCVSFDCYLDMSNILPNDYSFVYYIIGQESDYKYNVVNSETGSLGYCQLNPYWHDVPDNFDDPVVQLNWCNNYAITRYGSWYNAYVVWLNQGWW
jgi:hypothetical protein